ncbi:MAG: Ig-like domain-containing protein, partial [Dehalococcoidales bacterium]|nr:Ig-like domain-containing protein [Dehalococcoidales bacterium]
MSLTLMKKLRPGADLLFLLLVLPFCIVSFFPGATFFPEPAKAQVDPPLVVSTTPADGAGDARLDLESVAIVFNRQMNAGYSITSNFPAYSVFWSADQKTCTLRRNDLSTPLQTGMTYFFILNREGTPKSFQDLSGIPLDEYSFSFTTVA